MTTIAYVTRWSDELLQIIDSMQLLAVGRRLGQPTASL